MNKNNALYTIGGEKYIIVQVSVLAARAATRALWGVGAAGDPRLLTGRRYYLLLCYVIRPLPSIFMEY